MWGSSLISRGTVETLTHGFESGHKQSSSGFGNFGFYGYVKCDHFRRFIAHYFACMEVNYSAGSNKRKDAISH